MYVLCMHIAFGIDFAVEVKGIRAEKVVPHIEHFESVSLTTCFTGRSASMLTYDHSKPACKSTQAKYG